MNDPLGDRMKENYENRTRFYLPRRTYTLMRLDGKAFHTYTRKLKKPFDNDLSEDIDSAIINMLPEIQGVVLVYTQSDEISVLLTDFATPNTCAWFDGNLQKMVTVAASVMTGEFNKQRIIHRRYENKGVNEIPFAYFDCRAFTIPDRIEVMNYFRSRQQDCIRNSVSMVAQSKFSQKELNGKGRSAMHEMLRGIGVNWATDYTDGQKNGRLIIKETYLTDIKYNSITPVSGYKNTVSVGGNAVERTRWVSQGAWVFTKDEGRLLKIIPTYPI